MQRRTLLSTICSAAGTVLLSPALFISKQVLAAETVWVQAYDAAMKPVKVQVPADPKRIAVLDMAVLDVLDAWGLADRIVAMPKRTRVPFLEKHFENPAIRDVGTLQEIDLEGLMASEPEVIFISGRLAKKMKVLGKIAPVVYFTTDRNAGSLASLRKNVGELARLFGKEAEAEAALSGFDERAAKIRAASSGRTALFGLVTAAHVNLLGNSARGSLIGREFGFKNLAENANANHGNESSFELLRKLNPDYFFVLDRDGAIARPGAKLAKDILNNDMVRGMDAAKADRIVYLSGEAWYLAEGGLTATDIMFRDVETALGIGS